MNLEAIISSLRAGADPNADPAAKRRAADLLRSIATWIEGGAQPASSPAGAVPPPASPPAPPPVASVLPVLSPSIVGWATTALQVLDVITRHVAQTAPATMVAGGPLPYVRF